MWASAAEVDEQWAADIEQRAPPTQADRQSWREDQAAYGRAQARRHAFAVANGTEQAFLVQSAADREMHRQMYRLAEAAAAKKKQERAALAVAGQCSAEIGRTGPAAAAAAPPRLKKARTKAEAIAALKAGPERCHKGDWGRLRGVPVTRSGAEELAVKLRGSRGERGTATAAGAGPPRTTCGTQLAPAGLSEAEATPAQSVVRKFARARFAWQRRPPMQVCDGFLTRLGR